MLIDPSAITLAQTTFIQHINNAFGAVTGYALNLLYIFTAIEVVVFGLLWAFQHGAEWGKLIFKILKIGLIFFLIQSYPTIINSIVKSFAILGGAVANTRHLGDFIFNPVHIWQYGYNVSLSLLKSAALGGSFGLALIQTTIGSGILFIFALLGIQIVLQIVGFYLIALVALILIPFSVFNPASAMLDKSLQNVLKAGVRVMVVIAVIGVAVTIFGHFSPLDATTATSNSSQNISQFLGLLFTGLLFLCLAILLPKLASEAVGEISSQFGESSSVPIIVTPQGTATSALTSGNLSGSMNDMQAATNISAGPNSGNLASNSMLQPASTTIEAKAPNSYTAAPTSAPFAKSNSTENTKYSSAINKAIRNQSISNETLQKLNQTLEKMGKDK